MILSESCVRFWCIASVIQISLVGPFSIKYIFYDIILLLNERTYFHFLALCRSSTNIFKTEMDSAVNLVREHVQLGQGLAMTTQIPNHVIKIQKDECLRFSWV